MTDPWRGLINKMDITSFDFSYRFLSNFFVSPIVANNKVWPTVEHLYQSHKTMDRHEREKIRLAKTPTEAKRIGERVTLRREWEKVKKETMLECVRLKFSQHPDLAKKLLETENTFLVEGNRWHDNVWGDCRCLKCKDIRGQNLLGKILMQVRSELKAGII